MALTIRPHAEGATLEVRAQPKAKRDAASGTRGGALKVSVTAPPEDGRANAAVLDVLRAALKLPRGQLELLSGHTARDKVVLVRGVTPDELAARLAPLAGD
jgi:uncharacterized protein (TIGR00251 family)